MALHRVRARLRFPNNSGMAQWCRDNMQVRYEQAVHINVGTDAAEPPVNEVSGSGQHRVFTCDLPLMDESHAIDAFNTLVSVGPFAVMFPDDGEGEQPGYVERHTCHHDETPRQPCVVNQRQEVPSI